MLIGVDLQKSERVLNAAYNNAKGVTAAFNLNVLNVVNTLADADFQPDRFSHQAFYNVEHSRIEMHLISKIKQTVTIGASAVLFEQGESLHTENSYKYSLESLRSLQRRRACKCSVAGATMNSCSACIILVCQSSGLQTV